MVRTCKHVITSPDFAHNITYVCYLEVCMVLPKRYAGVGLEFGRSNLDKTFLFINQRPVQIKAIEKVVKKVGNTKGILFSDLIQGFHTQLILNWTVVYFVCHQKSLLHQICQRLSIAMRQCARNKWETLTCERDHWQLQLWGVKWGPYPHFWLIRFFNLIALWWTFSGTFPFPANAKENKSN